MIILLKISMIQGMITLPNVVVKVSSLFTERSSIDDVIGPYVCIFSNSKIQIISSISDFHFRQHTKCFGDEIIDFTDPGLAMSTCDQNPNCHCIQDVNCDHEQFRLFTRLTTGDEDQCAWRKRGSSIWTFKK